MTERNVTAQRLREILEYVPATGFFVWRSNKGRAKVGDVAGCDDGNGYMLISIDYRKYLAHRLVWLYVHGHWPSAEVDHVNGKRADNRLDNLREATHKENKQNLRLARADNRLGVLGVSPNGKGFAAKIVVDGAYRHIGTFITPELAHAAYLEAKRRLHPFGTV